MWNSLHANVLACPRLSTVKSADPPHSYSTLTLESLPLTCPDHLVTYKTVPPFVAALHLHTFNCMSHLALVIAHTAPMLVLEDLFGVYNWELRTEMIFNDNGRWYKSRKLMSIHKGWQLAVEYVVKTVNQTIINNIKGNIRYYGPFRKHYWGGGGVVLIFTCKIWVPPPRIGRMWVPPLRIGRMWAPPSEDWQILHKFFITPHICSMALFELFFL